MANGERRERDAPGLIPLGIDRRRDGFIGRWRRVRKSVRAGALGLAVAVAISGAMWAVVSSTSVNESQIKAIRAERIQSCKDDNVQDAKQIKLWEGVIAISRPPADETPAEKARRAETLKQFRALLADIFQPRDCENLAPIAAPKSAPVPTTTIPVIVPVPGPVVTATATATATTTRTVPGPTETTVQTVCRQRNGKPCPPRR